MKTLLTITAVAVVLLSSWHAAEAKAPKPPKQTPTPTSTPTPGGTASLATAALSVNPNSLTDNLVCLVSNLSATTSVSVKVEIVDGTGQSSSNTLVIAAGGVEGTTGGSANNFYTYCRITPDSAADLPLLRGNYCVTDTNATTKACTEAR